MHINEINAPVQPDTYEASMFLGQAVRAGKYAIQIHNMLSNDQEMESWVAKKLDLASSYISSVGHYLESSKSGAYDDDGMSEISKMPKGTGTMQGVKEDAGEGHMAKSQMYNIAEYCIKISTMVRPGDDIEAWVQTKMNRAVDMLDAVYHYEDYQKLNPYREDLGDVTQKHAQIIQKKIDEILTYETKVDDIETKPGMFNILKKRVNEVEKEMAKENRKNTEEGGMAASVIKSKQRYANMSDEELADRFKGADEKTLRQMAWRHGYGNMSSHYLDRVKNVMTSKRTGTTEAELEEGLKDWAKKTAAAGIIVAGLAGFNSINNAIDNSVPAIQAMNSALEMAQDQNDDELAKLIKKDLSDAKLRLDTGKDLSHVKDLQDKYAKFMKTEGLAYESKLAVQLKQRLK